MAHSFQWPAMGRSAGDRAAEPFAASSPLSSQRSSDSTRAMATSSPSFVISSSDNTSAISSSRQPPNSENKRPLWYWYYTFRDQYYLPIPERDEPIIRGTQVRLPEQATEEPPHVLKNKIRHLYEHCPGALEFIHRRMQKYRKKRIVETQGRSTKEEDRAAFAKYLSALMLREVKLYFERMTVAGSTRVQVPREIPAVPFAGQSTTSRTTPAAALRSIERRESVSSDDTTPVAPSFTTADESYSSLASMGPPEIDSRTEEEKALEKAATEHYFREQFILERNRKLANGLASGDTSTLSNSSTSSRYRDVEEINLDFDRSDLHTPVPHQSNVNYGEPRDTTPQQPLKQRQRNPEAQGSPPPYSPPAQQQHRSDASRPHNRTNEDRKGKGKQRAEADSESKQPSSKALDLSSDTETDPCSAIETRSISYAGPSNSAANSVPVGKPNTTMSEFKFNYQVKTNPSSRQLLKPKSKVIRSPPTVQPASVNPNAPQQIFGPPSSSVSAQPLFSEQLSFQPPPPPPASQQQQHQQHQSSQANQWNNQQQSLSQPDHRPFGSQPPQHNGRPFSQPAHQPFYSQSQEEDHRPFSQPQTQQPTQNFYRQDTQASSRSLPVQTYSQPNHRSLTRQESQESSQNSSQDSDFDTRRSSQTTIPSLSQQNSWNERTAGQQGGFKQPGLETLAEVSSNSSQSTAMRDGAGRATSRGGDDARNDGRVYGQGDGYGQGYGQSSRGYEGEYSLAPEEYQYGSQDQSQGYGSQSQSQPQEYHSQPLPQPQGYGSQSLSQGYGSQHQPQGSSQSASQPQPQGYPQSYSQPGSSKQQPPPNRPYPSSKNPSEVSLQDSFNRKVKAKAPPTLQSPIDLDRKENVRRQQREYTPASPILDDDTPPPSAPPERKKKASKQPSAPSSQPERKKKAPKPLTESVTYEPSSSAYPEASAPKASKTKKKNKGKQRAVEPQPVEPVQRVESDFKDAEHDVGNQTLAYDSPPLPSSSKAQKPYNGNRPAIPKPHTSRHSVGMNSTAIWEKSPVKDNGPPLEPLKTFTPMSPNRAPDIFSQEAKDTIGELADMFGKTNLGNGVAKGKRVSVAGSELGSDYSDGLSDSFMSALVHQAAQVERDLEQQKKLAQTQRLVQETMAEQRAPRLGPSKSVMNTKQSKAFASPSIPSSAFDNQYIDATLSKGKSSYSSPSKAQTAFPLPPLTQHNNAYTRLPRPESPVYKAEALKGLDFLIQYEFTRAALHAGSPPTNESYNALAEPYIRDLVDARVSSKQTFRVLQRVVQNNNPEAFKSFTNRTSDTMWNKMLDGVWKNSGYLTGKFILEPKGMQKDNTLGAPTRANSNQTFVDKNCKAHQFLSLKLSPPSFMTGNRYFRRFGSDRFLFLSLPNLDEIKEKGNSGELYAAFRESVNVDREKFRLDICKWLANTGGIEVANRLWVPYYLREKEESKGKNNNKKVKVFQVIFFATAGVGIGNSLGGRFETPVHEELSREKLLDWQIYITRAKFQTVAKLWSRISLALSTSTPTITFDWKQIRLVPDLTSPETGEVMDDGCCRISHAAMGEVRAALGLSKKPAAVQGRVGGAKGVWFVDPNNHSDDIWICVNESQMKYGWHRSDQKGTTNEPSRLTLDVLNCSKAMTPAKLNSQLIAILDAGRVPFEVLAVLAREFIDARLEEVASALKNRVALREWVYKQGALTQSRRREKSVDSLGGVPMIVQERAVLLLESGFMPQANPYLRDLLEASLEEFVFQAKDKLHIEVPQSTVVMCIADPCGVLEEGECWLALKDDEIPGLDEQNVVGDILVARNPALLPSDIQKVRAVEDKERYKGLRMLKDVIVFSTKGPYSLASKLSGGDYDGDKVWCTWDARLVEPFQNSPVPREEEVGYDKNEWFFTDKTEVKDVMRTGDVWATDFYERAFQLSTVESMLGMYTYHHSECAYIYGLKDRRSQALAFVCGALVDAPKQGYVLKPNHEGILRKKVDLSPAKNGLPYRDSKSDWTPPIGGWTNVLDRLVFDVIGNYLQSRHDELRALMTPPPEEDFQEDPDLALPSQEFEEEMTPVQQQMRHQLTRELDQILQTWNKHWSVKDKTLEKQSKKKRGNGKASKDAEGPWGDENFEDSGFRELVEGLRESFLEIAPAPELAEQDSLLRAYARRDKVTGELKNEEWQRLKASFAYRLWPQAKIKRDGSKEVKKVVWWVAGYELCAIKIAAGGGGQVVGKRRADGTELVVRSGGNGYRPVLSDVYVSLRTMKDWEVVGLEGDGDGLEENKEFGGWE